MEKLDAYETVLDGPIYRENTNIADKDEPILLLEDTEQNKQTKETKETKEIKQTKPTKQIGYRFGCDHYLEFCITEEVKEAICNPGIKSTNLDICKRIGNTINLPDNRKLMFIHGQSRYYHDDKDNCDILLLDYTKNIFTTRRGELPRLIVEKSPYVNSLDEIVVILRQIHKLYKDGINNNSKITN